MQVNLEEALSNAVLHETHAGHICGTLAAVLHLHHVPGRLRVCLATLKRNEPAVIPLRAKLLAMQGVKSVSINSITGSVIVYYDRDRFEPEKFWTTLTRLGFLNHAPRCVSPCRTRDKADAIALNATAAVVQVVMKTLLGAILEQCMLRSAGALIRLLI